MSRSQFVADNSATFEMKRLCELVETERSSYYARVMRTAGIAGYVKKRRDVGDITYLPLAEGGNLYLPGHRH